MAPQETHVLTVGQDNLLEIRFDGTFTVIEQNSHIQTHVPFLKFQTAMDGIAAEKADSHADNDMPEHIRNMITAMQNSANSVKNAVVTRDDAKRISEFIVYHAPWVQDYDYLLHEAVFTENIEHIRPEYLHDDEKIAYLRLCLACCPIFLPMKPNFIVSDMFYVDTNVYTPVDILRVQNMKTLYRNVFGYYSKELVPVMQHVLDHEVDFTKLVLLQYARNMSVASIKAFADILQNIDISIIDHRGVPMVDDTLFIPDWFLQLSDQARLRWLDSISLLTDAISMTQNIEHIEALDIDFRDMYASHETLIEHAVSTIEEDFTNPLLPNHDETYMVDDVEVVNTYSSKGLKKLSLYMNICIDDMMYMRNLQEGISVFFSGWKDGKPVFASEFNDNGKLVEISGKDNAPLETDFQQNIVTSIYEHYFERNHATANTNH